MLGETNEARGRLGLAEWTTARQYEDSEASYDEVIEQESPEPAGIIEDFELVEDPDPSSLSARSSPRGSKWAKRRQRRSVRQQQQMLKAAMVEAAGDVEGITELVDSDDEEVEPEKPQIEHLMGPYEESEDEVELPKHVQERIDEILDWKAEATDLEYEVIEDIDDEEYERMCEIEDGILEDIKQKQMSRDRLCAMTLAPLMIMESVAALCMESIVRRMDGYEVLLSSDDNGDTTESVRRNDPRPLHLIEGEYFETVNVAETCRMESTTEEYMREPVEVAADSGAGEHVASRSAAAAYKVEPSPGSRAGQHFISAGKEKIPNEGQMILNLKDDKGKKIRSTFQVANVTRPLWSVGRICDEGFEVKLKKTYAVVLTSTGKEVCRFERRGGLYIARLDLKSPNFQGFVRQGKQ